MTFASMGGASPAAYVCHVPRKTQLSNRVTALPWHAIDELIPLA